MCIVASVVGRRRALAKFLTSLDPRNAIHAAAVSERLKGATDEGFLDALPRIVDQLLAEHGK
jgi:hypothetical protein